MATVDSENSASSGRNSFGEVRCYYRVPNSVQDSPNTLVDPSVIEVLAVSSAATQFFVDVDLVQVIPYTYSQARIDGSACDPPVSMAVNSNPNTPLTLDGSVFQNPGFRVRWDSDVRYIFSGRDHQPLRVYRQTGDPDHPLADITCMTYFSGPFEDRYVQIRYTSGPDQLFSKLPPGNYQIATFDRADQTVKTTCQDSVYSTLLTLMTGPIERIMPLAPEYFFIRIPIPNDLNPGDGCVCPRILPPCVADVDDGSMLGVPDGGVTIDDLLYFLMIFDLGTVCADVDDGTATATCDGGVTIDDLLYYLFRFEAGC